MPRDQIIVTAPPAEAERRTRSGDGDSAIPIDTILALFGDPGAPDELTEFDRALVTKLYNMPHNASSARIFGAVYSRTISLEKAGSGSGD